MATTEFTDTSTRIVSTWLNAVDAVVYDILNGATTVAAAKIALGIGTTDNPTFTNLTLTGVIKIGGGSPGTGKVLTSDADGDATWQTLSVDTTTITLTDNDSTAFEVKESTNSYINIDTTNGAELVTFGNATINPDFTFEGTPNIGIAVASTVARLEIEDAGLPGSASTPIVKITQDDETPSALVLGNDTFSTTDTHGLRFRVSNAGSGNITCLSPSGASYMGLGLGGGTNIYTLVLDTLGNVLVGGLAGTDAAAKLEVEDGATTKSVLLKVTQDDQSVLGLVIGNDSFSTSDLYGITLSTQNDGTGIIQVNGVTGGSGLLLGARGLYPIWIKNNGRMKIGDVSTGQAIEDSTVCEFRNREVGTTRIIRVTQNDQTEKAIIIGNETFLTGEDQGLTLYRTNTGVDTILAAGTGAGMQIGVAADTDAVNIDATNGGLYMGGATGSSKGTGTINATGFYVNGVASGNVTNGDSHDHDGGDGAAIPSGGIGSQAITSSKFKATSTETTQTGLLTTPYVLPSGLHWVTSFTTPSSESTTLQVYVNGGWRSTGLLINATPRVVWSDGTNMRITDTSNSPVVYIRSMD